MSSYRVSQQVLDRGFRKKNRIITKGEKYRESLFTF